MSTVVPDANLSKANDETRSLMISHSFVFVSQNEIGCAFLTTTIEQIEHRSIIIYSKLQITMCIPVRARDRRQAIASIHQITMAKRSGTMAASLPTLGNTDDDDGLLSSSLSQASLISSSSLSQVPSSSWVFKTPEARSTRSLSVLSPPSTPNKRRRLDVDYNCKPVCIDDESLFIPLLKDMNMEALKDKDMNAVPTFNLKARPTKLSIPPRKEAPASTVRATASTNKNTKVGKIPLPTFEDGSSRTVLKMKCDHAITA